MNAPKPAVVDQATLDWEGWSDPTLAAKSAIRWKLLITGERTASRGLVTGVAQLAPGEQLLPHHHEPEETYYIVSGQGEMEIDDETTAVGPGCAIYIPANARHALRCTGSEPLFFVFAFGRDRFDQIEYHFVQYRQRSCTADDGAGTSGDPSPPASVPVAMSPTPGLVRRSPCAANE